jgi:purine-cytosine permease-like protein
VTGQSWHNHAHDLASGVLYAALLVAPLLLARRFRGDPQWQALRLPAIATTAGSAALLALFWSEALAQWGGVIQRVIATVPLTMMAALAVKLLAAERPPLSSAARRGPSWRGRRP